MPRPKPSPTTPAAKPTRKPGSGGVSRYTEKWAIDICNKVAAGSNLTRISKAPGGYPIATMFDWLAKHPEFAERYASARELRADSRSDRIDDVCDKVATGEIDPAAARVIIDAEKWQAGKERPARYGDKLAIDQTTRVAPMTPEQMTEQMSQSPAFRAEIAEMLAKSANS